MKQKFKSELLRATIMASVGNDRDYWIGYQRGLRRKFHGDKFGTRDEHYLWMALADSKDHSRRQRGKGYLEGFNFDGGGA